MKAKIGFFQESEGQDSMMRLLSFCSFLVCAFIAVYSVVTRKEGGTADPQIVVFFFGFLIGAFVPKAVQKFAENTDVTKSSMTKSTIETKSETS